MNKVYWYGAPKGRFYRFFSIKLLQLGYFRKKKVELHAAGIVFLQKRDDLKNLRSKCKELILVGYQHGGGYYPNSTLESHIREFEACDFFIFWDLEKKSIHRWGLISIIHLEFNTLFRNGSSRTYLVMPCLSEELRYLDDEKHFLLEQWTKIWSVLPQNTQVIWHPRDSNQDFKLEKVLTKRDKVFFIGVNPTLLWFCVRFNIYFRYFRVYNSPIQDKRLEPYQIII